MNKIARYKRLDILARDKEGYFVKYKDHKAEVDGLKSEIDLCRYLYNGIINRVNKRDITIKELQDEIESVRSTLLNTKWSHNEHVKANE